MTKFKDIIITSAGQNALNLAVTAGHKITYTKASLASDDLASKSISDVQAITTLNSVKNSDLARLGSSNGSTVLSVTFDNSGLTNDMKFNSVGWYAKTGDAEFLFAVSRYDQEQVLGALEPGKENVTQSITLQIALAVSQGTVNVTQTQAGVAMKSDLNTAVDNLSNSINQLSNVKADKDTVTADLAKKADQSSVDASVKSINDVLATKANSSDVKSLNDLIATKADAETVNNAISKIDFTPYAKSVDVNKQVSDLSNQEKTDIASVNKALAGKQDAGYSYSKAELDKKLLAMSTTTDGKIDATQVQNMIAGKANTADVNNQIETVTNLANNNYNKRPVIDGSDGDDLFAFKTNQLRLYPGNGKNCKNLPPAINTQWFTVEYVFETPNGDGVAIYRSPAPEIWLVGNNGGTFNTWRKVSDANDITNLQSQINNLKGLRSADNPNFNTLIDSGTYYISSPSTANHAPEGSWGNLLVSNGNGQRTSQMYFPDSGGAPYVRVLDGSTWRDWIQLSTTAQTSNAQNTADQAKNLATQANNGLTSKADASQVNLVGTLFRMITNSDTWQDIFGVTNSNNVLTSLRINAGGTGSLLNNYAAGIGFGGADTKGVLSVAYGDHQARITGGNGGSPVWSEDIAWKSDINNLQGQINNKANASDLAGYAKSTDVASKAQITDLQNQISELKDSSFEVQTFKDEASGKAWEAQKAGHRLAIIQS